MKDAGLALGPSEQRTTPQRISICRAGITGSASHDFYDAHKWKDARIEYDKLVAMLKDPADPIRQRALVRSAECRPAS